jgi:hypothetical protein
VVPGDLVVTIPNPHGQDIGVVLLARVLRQAGVTQLSATPPTPWRTRRR